MKKLLALAILGAFTMAGAPAFAADTPAKAAAPAAAAAPAKPLPRRPRPPRPPRPPPTRNRNG